MTCILIFCLFLWAYFFYCACMLSRFNHVWLFVTLWTVARQSSLPKELSRQEYWSGLPSPFFLPTTPVFQHFLNVADAIFKALSVFENWVLTTFAFPWHVRENCILTGFVFCVLSLPNLLLLSLVQRICNWSWFSPNIMFLDNGPCLGYRKPNQPYRWLSYKQVSRAHDFG